MCARGAWVCPGAAFITVITDGAGDPAGPWGGWGQRDERARVRAGDMSVFSMIRVGNPHHLRAGNPDHEKPGRAAAAAAGADTRRHRHPPPPRSGRPAATAA